MNVTISADYNDLDLENWIMGDVQDWFNELKQDSKQAAKKFVDRIIAGQVPGVTTWNNRTWNLRSSIGYLLVFNGAIEEEYFPEATGSEGNQTGKSYAEEIALFINEGEGIQIVIVAGMEYAVFVEGRSIDVLSHASKGFPKQWLSELNTAV